MKTKPKLKARRMWANPQEMREHYMCLTASQDPSADRENTLPVAVIPLADTDALIRTAGDAFHDSYDGHICQSDIVAMLTAIGVLPRSKKGRK
jgi:hypothetical protein